MRVYEFAKKWSMPTKELIAVLQQEGFDVASHMSVLSDDALSFLSKKFEKKDQKIEKPATQKNESSAKIVKQEKPKVIEQPQKMRGASESKQPEQFLPQAPEEKVVTKLSTIKSFKQEVETPKQVKLTLTPMTLADFATAIQKPFTDVILSLLKWGILANKNQLLSIELVSRLAQHYQVVTSAPEVVAKKEIGAKESQTNGQERLPIVVVMGHVDHGKTTLLDYIRKTRVAAKEKGGITQHLGAYQAKTAQGSIVFLDTPGHEAFSKIRARGAHIADIAILVVAADDGVMPQTVEAIKHAKAMKVPIIVAVNKIDKAEPTRVEIIKHELGQQYELMPEEWGGHTIYVPISAKLGKNIDKLLDMVILQSQLMELKAVTDKPAQGYILEAKIEKGLGAVATFIAQNGTLSVGDYFVTDTTGGRVSVLRDSFDQRINQVGPSVPVLIGGFDQLPEAGENLKVVSKDSYLASKQQAISSKNIAAKSRVINPHDINIIVKADTDSSKEALIESIEKISKKLEKKYTILQANIGALTESDVTLAYDTGSRIFLLHVKPEPKALALAQNLGVVIETFDIIYKLLERLQEWSNSLREAKKVKKLVGQAVVRKVFDIKELGVIAGAYVREGIFSREGFVTIYRGNKKIGEGKISSLQRDRRPVKEVHSGFECAFMVDDFREWEVDDRVECYIEQSQAAG